MIRAGISFGPHATHGTRADQNHLRSTSALLPQDLYQQYARAGSDRSAAATVMKSDARSNIRSLSCSSCAESVTTSLNDSTTCRYQTTDTTSCAISALIILTSGRCNSCVATRYLELCTAGQEPRSLHAISLRRLLESWPDRIFPSSAFYPDDIPGPSALRP
jgi:hypothetical protein